jgi:FkbM family methyltransferase
MERYREGSLPYRLLHGLMGVVRGYVRYSPNPLGKTTAIRWLWNVREKYFIDRRVATRSVPCETSFGAVLHCQVLLDFIQGFIYLFGTWEPNLTAWLRSRLQPGDVFVDVGANIGYFSLLASEAVGKGGKVVAIEASPSIFAELKANLLLNDVRNVRAVNMAVLDRKGTVAISRGPAYNQGMSSIVPTGADFTHEAEVEGGPLGDLLTDEEIARVRLIKIDVEGAEWQVVEGLLPLFGRLRPDVEFVVEVAPERKAANDIVRVFREAGYTLQEIENSYHPLTYLDATVVPPRPFGEATVTRQMDLIATRKL